MESLAESVREQPAMPRFEDGSANPRELMRRIAEDVVNAIMDAEADQLCAGGANSRNGYRERNLVTCVGDITMRIPKLRSGSFFPEDVVERAVAPAMAEMYATGTATRKVQGIAEKLEISRLPKDQVSANQRHGFILKVISVVSFKPSPATRRSLQHAGTTATVDNPKTHVTRKLKVGQAFARHQHGSPPDKPVGQHALLSDPNLPLPHP